MDFSWLQPALLKKAQRRLWMKYAMRSGSVGNPGRFRLAYRINDPWNMESALEEARFEATNRIIEKTFGRVGSVLELGCGEGHQTRHLAKVSDHQYGIDISPHAIARAQARVPSAHFAATDVFDLPWQDTRHRFDLVTACEMLYCLDDPTPTIERMRHLGRNGLVTFFAPAGGRLEPHLQRIPGLHKDWFSFRKTVWLVGWWRND